MVDAAERHLVVVHRVAERSRQAHASNRALRADLARFEPGPVVARSRAMRATLDRVALVARHPTTVLITGESGTGKEVLAREVHRRSPRAHRPMVQLNCGAIPAPLVESELFGHARGAFTGAERVHVGAFERADGGTLLLDEVAELPLAAQVALLRVLQERQIRRLGGAQQLDVDVRVIAATHRPLRELVRAGRFREDLYYRLDVFAIAIPPLRARMEDLAPLVVALVGELAARLGVEPPAVPRSLLQRLAAYDWPGNVRELANVLETGLVLGDGGGIVLPAGFGGAARPPTGGRATTAYDAAVRGTLEDALRSTRGKIYGRGGAAALLGLKPGTLQSKLRKLGIERRDFVG